MELSSHIAYLVYYDKPDRTYSPILPSDIITSSVLACLKFLPKNLVQIKKPLHYFNLITTGEHLANDRLFISSGFPSGHERLLNFEIVIILWDKKELPPPDFKKHFNMPVIFRDVYHPRSKDLKMEEFSKSILGEIEKIVLKEFDSSSRTRKLFLTKSKPLKGLRNGPNFYPCITNYSTVRQIKGWFADKLKLLTVNDVSKRPALMLESVKEVDGLHYVARSSFNKTQREINEKYKPYYPVPTLIMICPWVNPVLLNVKNIKQLADRMKKTYDEAFLFGKIVTAEQDKDDYRFYMEESVSARIVEDKHMQAVHFAQMVSKTRIEADDNIGLLHSSFQFSPVMRFPLIGKSIEPQLSWFSPKNLNKRKDQTENYRKLLELGEVLSSKISGETKDYLSERIGPICFISDLPMEIATVEKVPLFFLKDVCRLPETNHESALGEYVKHSVSDYKMSEDLLKRTLVVCTNPSDENIKTLFEIIRDHIHKTEEGRQVRFEFCRTIQELAILVKEFKPELLILDTHGGTREEHLDSFLIVENEKLTCSEIVKYNISAPLVILSSCLTAPTYGYVNPLAHGFFEAGAHSVLSSILPLAMMGANVLYSRILTNLQKALIQNIHDSWAGFIAHNLRTSLFDDYKQYISLRLNCHYDWIDDEKYLDVRVNWQSESFYDENRSRCFHEIQDRLLEITKSEFRDRVKAILDRLDGFTPDAFAYTLIGRADLIKMPQRLKLYEKYIESLDIPKVGRFGSIC